MSQDFISIVVFIAFLYILPAIATSILAFFPKNKKSNEYMRKVLENDESFKRTGYTIYPQMTCMSCNSIIIYDAMDVEVECMFCGHKQQNNNLRG